MDDQPKCKVIDITGRLPKPALPPGQVVTPPKRIRVDRGKDPAVDLTMQFMDAISKNEWDAQDILLAINLLSHTIYAELIQRFGRKDFMRLAAHAQGLAHQYEPVFYEQNGHRDDGERDVRPEHAGGVSRPPDGEDT